MKKVLVTGGAGYIGSILVRKLLKNNYKVIVLDNLTYGEESLIDLKTNNNFELCVGDVKNKKQIINSIKGVDAVIHLAGIVGDPACAKNSKLTNETNYLPTKQIVELCKSYNINRFIFGSTCSVYGSSNENELLNENSKHNPLSLYAQDKSKSEKLILNLTDDNFSPTILRIGTIYGLSYRPRFDLVLNILTANAVINNEFTIFGGGQWRPLVHVDDVATSFLKVLEAPKNKIKGEVFNVGSNDQNKHIIDLGKIIKKIIPNSKMNIKKMKIDKRDYKVDFNKIKNVLNFKPKYGIEEGIIEIKEGIEKGLIKDFNNPNFKNVNE